MDKEGLQIERLSGATEDISDALSLRERIFILEQGVPVGRESDGLDDVAEHYVGRFAGEAIAVARVRYDDLTTARLERIGVLEPMRGEGTGQELMEQVLEDLRLEGVRSVTLNSQVEVQGFYEKLGFTPVGEPFIEEATGLPHIRMDKQLLRPNRVLG